MLSALAVDWHVSAYAGNDPRASSLCMLKHSVQEGQAARTLQDSAPGVPNSGDGHQVDQPCSKAEKKEEGFKTTSVLCPHSASECQKRLHWHSGGISLELIAVYEQENKDTKLQSFLFSSSHKS